EPGSNSPNKNKNVKAQKNQPTKKGQPAIPTKNTQKQKTGIKNKQTHYRVHKQHPHDQAHTNISHVFERCSAPCFRDSSFSLRSLPFGATRKTIRTCPSIVKSSAIYPATPQLSQNINDFLCYTRPNCSKIGDFNAPDHKDLGEMCASTRKIHE
ncbi:hypothetical protein, partial [Schaalia odontolytica]|uniref:hypothetical protein n=1 Tax=Schaalia odontolytica TaxID=1660 RepID=UPI0019D6D603